MVFRVASAKTSLCGCGLDRVSLSAPSLSSRIPFSHYVKPSQQMTESHHEMLVSASPTRNTLFLSLSFPSLKPLLALWLLVALNVAVRKRIV